MRGNIITATFNGWETARTSPIYQYDYGQILQFSDLELPDTYEVQFADNEYRGSSLTMIGNSGGVEVPDALLAKGTYVYAFIFLHSEDSDGETEYKVTIPVRKRPDIEYIEPPPVQQDIITQAIAALNLATEKAESSATDAAESATEAEHYADLAGQAAATAGYMEIEIDEYGHLIYTRTDAVDVDFSLDTSGHLIMEAV